MGFLEFIRDIGKCITVNYMMAKDSVKKRFSGEGDGMSFTEFTYQLVQGYDFLHLYQTMGCKIQLGGADQMCIRDRGTAFRGRTFFCAFPGVFCVPAAAAAGTVFRFRRHPGCRGRRAAGSPGRSSAATPERAGRCGRAGLSLIHISGRDGSSPAASAWTCCNCRG